MGWDGMGRGEVRVWGWDGWEGGGVLPRPLSMIPQDGRSLGMSLCRCSFSIGGVGGGERGGGWGSGRVGGGGRGEVGKTYRKWVIRDLSNFIFLRIPYHTFP